MTSVEKKIASDPFVRDKIQEILPLFSGLDFETADNIICALKLILKKNAVFDFESGNRNIAAYFEEIQEEI